MRMILIQKRSIGCALLLATCLLASTSIANSSPNVPYQRAHYVMGTLFEIKAYGEDGSSTVAAIEEAFGIIREADHVMSSYRNNSDLTYLNSHAGDKFVAVREDLFHLIEASIEYSNLTDGAFDITVGPLMRAWGFLQGPGRVPTFQERLRLQSIVGYRHVQLNRARHAIRFEVPGVEIDLGGIAKGWAVDRAADLLRSRGIHKALISAGTSSIYACGAPPDQNAWPIGIRDPLHQDEIMAIVLLKDMSLSTSGSYERYVRVHGKRYSHIMNPKTGWPVENVLSATVVAPTALESDSLSTGVFVMGPERGSTLLTNRGLEGLFVYRNRRRVATRTVSRPSASSIYLARQ